MEFHEKLRALRKEKGLTQEELSRKLHISRAAVSKWESARGLPNIEALKNLSRLFGTPIDELLSEQSAPSRRNRPKSPALLPDLLVPGLILLPLYAKPEGDFIRSVSLPRAPLAPPVKTLYFLLLILPALPAMGRRLFAKLPLDRIALLLQALALLLFILRREPYLSVFLFLIFTAKTLLLRRKGQL